MPAGLAPFKELDFPFVFFCRGASCERAQVAALARFRVLFTRIQSIFAGRQLPNHRVASVKPRMDFLCSARPSGRHQIIGAPDARGAAPRFGLLGALRIDASTVFSDDSPAPRGVTIENT